MHHFLLVLDLVKHTPDIQRWQLVRVLAFITPVLLLQQPYLMQANITYFTLDRTTNHAFSLLPVVLKVLIAAHENYAASMGRTFP